MNLAYSSSRMASNRLTREQVEDLYRTNKLSVAFEPTKVDDIIEIMNHFKGTAEIGDTKNASSFRVIPVPETVRPAAMELRKTDKKFIWEAGRKGKPCNPSYFGDKFKECLATIEDMPLLTPHCCRVTYVSIMQALGVKLETISHLVGHTTTRITESRYLRVQNEACQDALDRFDQRFGFGS